LEKFLEPSFEDSDFVHLVPSATTEWTFAVVGGLVSLAGIGLAYVIYMQRRGTTARLIDRFPAVHGFLANKWYWDELYDYGVVRPMVAFGNFGRTVIESRFIQDTIIGGAVGAVRVGTTFARSIQSGYLRAYALLLIAGMVALGLYFLLQST
jgi:NADH-quinone oxidoreductase subunit L